MKVESMITQKQHTIFLLLTAKYSTLINIHKQAIKKEPNLKLNNLSDTLLKLISKQLCIRLKIDGFWQYKLSDKTSEFNVVAGKKPKSQNKKVSKSRSSIPFDVRVYNVLCENVGKVLTLKDISKHMKIVSGHGKISEVCKRYHSDCFLALVNSRPIAYEILPDIIHANKKTEQPLETKTNQQNIPVLIPPNIKTITPQVFPDTQEDGMANAFNSMLKLHQQNTIYKATLENIASLLEQAGIIESD